MGWSIGGCGHLIHPFLFIIYFFLLSFFFLSYFFFSFFLSSFTSLLSLSTPSSFLHLCPLSLQIMAEYKYSQLENIAVEIVDDAVTLNMRTTSPEEQRSFNFETHQKEDIANLIASYSPMHSNWQRVGEAKTKNVSCSLASSR